MNILKGILTKTTKEQQLKDIDDEIDITKAKLRLREAQGELAEMEAKITNAKNKKQNAQPKKSLMDIFDGKGA